jgi:hypothetical protein
VQLLLSCCCDDASCALCRRDAARTERALERSSSQRSRASTPGKWASGGEDESGGAAAAALDVEAGSLLLSPAQRPTASGQLTPTNRPGGDDAWGSADAPGFQSHRLFRVTVAEETLSPAWSADDIGNADDSAAGAAGGGAARADVDIAGWVHAAGNNDACRRLAVSMANRSGLTPYLMADGVEGLRDMCSALSTTEYELC